MTVGFNSLIFTMDSGNDGSDSGDDRALVCRAIEGDHAAFDELVRRHRKRVFQFCFRIVSHHQDAEDLTEDTFLRAWLKRQTFQQEKASAFEAWILTIARNLCNRFLSQRQTRQTFEIGESSTYEPANSPTPVGADGIGWISLKHAAVDAMDALPTNWRTAFSMMLEGHAYDHIARQMGITTSYAGVLLNRARRRLQERLAPLVGDAASGPTNGATRQRQASTPLRAFDESVWNELETELRGLVTDYRLVRVPVNSHGGTLQLWIPVLDIARTIKFKQRMRTFQSKVATHPDDSESWWQLGEAHRANGNLDEAVKAYKRAIAPSRRKTRRPRASAVWTQLGECLWKLERRKEAAQAFQRALKLAATTADRLVLQGHLHALRHEYSKAIHNYMRAIAVDLPLPVLLSIRHHIATCHRANNRPDLAAKEYERIIKQDPKDAEAYDLVADCYRELGDWNKTVAALERAVEVVPHSARTLRHLAQKLGDTGQQIRRAIELAERAAHIAPQSWQCWKTLGHVYHRAGRLEDAKAAYEKSIKISPHTAEAYQWYAAFHSRSGDYRRVLWAMKKAHRLDPENLIYWGSIAEASINLGRHREAVKWTNRLARRLPSVWNLCCFLSQLYQDLGHISRAVSWAQKAAQMSPTLSHARWALGCALSAQGRFKDAANAFERALSLLPRDIPHMSQDLYLALGHCYRRLGDERRALTIFHAGAKTIHSWYKAGHTDLSLHMCLTKICVALGDIPSARASAKRVMAHPLADVRSLKEAKQLMQGLTTEI